mgnify:CR=1 FL=1
MELSINNVTKQFKVKKAVDDISFSMKNGVYGLLGVNGAGKTTLMRMLCTLTTPDCGMITWDGKDIFKMGASYRQILGYLPQDFGYYPYLTIYDYMMYIASIKGIRPAVAKKRTKELLKQVGLSDQKKQKMRNLSGGMVRRVGIAQAMLNDPKILVLDEPTAGLDPKERVRFRNILSVLSKDRIVILSTHIVSDIESIANHVIMIKEKQLLKNDTVPNICKELEGKVFEKSINESEIQEFEQKRIILSMRQESEKMMVRYYSEEEDNNARPCTPNLEDVFLVTYREEK